MVDVTLDEAVAAATNNGRVCLQPQWWSELYKLLPDTKQSRMGWEPALPLILSAWWETSILEKTIRFREHLEYAETHGCLAEIFEFMTRLAEENWYHGEDDDSRIE